MFKQLATLSLLLLIMVACNEQRAETPTATAVTTNTPIQPTITAVPATPTLAPTATAIAPTLSPTSDTSQEEEPDLSNPPTATIKIEGVEQVGGLGTFCWAQGARGAIVCLDSLGIPTNAEPIVVEGEFTALFQLPPVANLTTLVADVTPVTTDNELDQIGDDQRWWDVRRSSERQRLSLDADTMTTNVQLDPGLYLINLFAAWDTVGDANYGFLVEVQ